MRIRAQVQLVGQVTKLPAAWGRGHPSVRSLDVDDNIDNLAVLGGLLIWITRGRRWEINPWMKLRYCAHMGRPCAALNGLSGD